MSADIAQRLREAFDGEDVVAKNIALRQAFAAIDRLTKERDEANKDAGRLGAEVLRLQGMMAQSDALLNNAEAELQKEIAAHITTIGERDGALSTITALQAEIKGLKAQLVREREEEGREWLKTETIDMLHAKALRCDAAEAALAERERVIGEYREVLIAIAFQKGTNDFGGNPSKWSPNVAYRALGGRFSGGRLDDEQAVRALIKQDEKEATSNDR